MSVFMNIKVALFGSIYSYLINRAMVIRHNNKNTLSVTYSLPVL